MYKEFSISVIILFIFLASCTGQKQNGESPALAVVGKETLYLNDALSHIPPFVLQQDTLNSILSFTDQWIHDQLSVQQAKRIGLVNAPEVQKRMNRIYDQILKDALAEYVLILHEDELIITTEQAQNYYQEHKDRFVLDEKYVRFRHITTRTRTEADNANRDLMRAVPWEEILNRYSVNPELQLRQSNQFWPISLAASDIPMLNQYLNIIGITERSPIYHYQGQYHLVQLMEERPDGDHPDLEWLIPQIKEWLKLEKARRITNSYLRNLYLEAEANNEIQKTTVNEMESIISNHLSYQ